MSDRWICMVCGYTHKGSAPPAHCPSCGAPFTAFEKRDKDPRARFAAIEVSAPRPAGFRYVIIGNSSAGRAAAHAIRMIDDDAQITVISEEPSPFYCRPLLPDLIGGLTEEDFFAANPYAEDDRLRLTLGETVAAVDTSERTVQCASGLHVPYDALLLAVGSAPIRIPWPGSEAEGVAYFRTFADAQRIAQMAANAKRAVVVGGGLLGLEFVRAFHTAGLSITLLVRESRVGAPAVDEDGGAVLREALLDLGVELALEEEVESFESASGRVSAVNSSRGRRIECDLVGIAVGARPRLELAQALGLDTDRGILVSRGFETSVPGIYAAGDVAQAHDRLWDEPRVNTSWRNSREQGEYAGIAMAGGKVEYPGALAANYQLAAGLPFCSLGISNPQEPEGYEVEIQSDPSQRTFRKIVRRSGAIVGACLIGDLSRAPEIEQALAPTSAAPAQPVTTSAPPTHPQEGKSTMHKMTEAYLKDAFAGESQAHMKYLNFAEKAEEEGNANVARIFRAASFSEQLHASAHLATLEGIGSSSENLAEAMDGEGFEIDEMYPAYMAVAEEQGEEDAKISFHQALEAEKVHHGLYSRAKQAVDGGKDAEVGALWVCTACGFTMEGEPPARCPICSAPKKFFKEF